jgi:YesN/AraC family two-component response regulator
MPDTAKKRVLVVDDEKVIRDLLTKVMEFYEYDSIEAEDGAIAWETFQRDKPDLVISDIYMPHLSGIHLLRNIRRADPSTKVILITGYSTFTQFTSDSQSRPDAFFIKPLEIEVLATTMNQLLSDEPVGETK